MNKLYIEKNITSEDLLAKVCKEYNIDKKIIYNEYGKPYIKDNPIYFNISHSGDYTVLAISDQEIGIDIEKITMREKVIKKVCNEEEKKLIKTQEDFTLMWVKKESYVKYLGIGLAYDLINVDTLKLNFYIIKFDNYYISIYKENKVKL